MEPERFKILVVENTPSMAAVLVEKLERDERFEVFERSDAGTAIQSVQDKHFDVIFIDLHLDEKDSGEPIFDGIAVGEAVRKRLPHAVIVMYSQQIRAEKETKFPHFDECVRAGADKIIARGPLFSYTQQKLSALIDTLIAEKRKAETAKSNVKFSESLQTLAAIDTFGETKLRRLLAACAKKRAYLNVEAIQAGFSGAGVFRVAAATDSKFVDSLRLIIKVSESEFALKDELQRNPLPGSLYGSSSALPATCTVATIEDLSGVAFPEVTKRVLLRDYLLEGKLTSLAEKVLSRVVSELLVAPAKETWPASDLGLSQDSYRLRPAAVLEIENFLSEALEWKTVLEPSDFEAIRFTQNLTGKALSGHWNFTLNGRHVAKLHGDFHCRNVFVSSKDAPFLIDFGRSDIYPRLFDFGALDADIALSVLDNTRGQDQDFSNIQRWCRCIIRDYPYAELPTALSRKSRLDFLRSKLLKSVQQLQNVSRMEYAETLVFHYLRYLRFTNLPNPKKILALHLIRTLCRSLGIA